MRRDFADTIQIPQVWYWLPPIAYASFIFYLSSLSYPEEVLPNALVQSFSDQWLHLIEYGVLAALCYPAFRCSASPNVAVLMVVVASSFYGVTDEVHQAFIPFREATWLDWAADTTGAMIAAFSIRKIDRTSVGRY
jgi:VanZ family protein